ncbi:MAG TPA: hypothetical protein PLN07_02695, partial [Myxococcota bacterium]|nr:hypothetical protein [Myxococcota bacterium]
MKRLFKFTLVIAVIALVTGCSGSDNPDGDVFDNGNDLGGQSEVDVTDDIADPDANVDAELPSETGFEGDI